MPELLKQQHEAVAQRNRLSGAEHPLSVNVLLIPR